MKEKKKKETLNLVFTKKIWDQIPFWCKKPLKHEKQTDSDQ